MAVETDTLDALPPPYVVPSASAVETRGAQLQPYGNLQPRNRLRRLLKGMGEFAALCALAIVLLEGIFRLCGIGQQEFLQSDAVLGCRHIPSQLVTWRLEGYSSDYLNSVGLRDVEHSIAKPAAVTRVALLGDSTTEGLQVPLQATYARVLEKELNGAQNIPTNMVRNPKSCSKNHVEVNAASHNRYEVINFACSSYSTGQEYLQFKKDVEQYKPDITIVLYNCGDSLENIRDPDKTDAEPRSYFYLDAAGHLQQDDLLLKKMSQQPEGGTVLANLMQFLQRNSRIYGVLKQEDLILSINEKLYRKLRFALCSMFAATTGTAGTAQFYKAHYIKQDGMKVGEQLLLALNKECKQVNSRLIVALFPNINNNIQYAGEQKELRAFAAQNKLQLLDLTGVFLSATKPGELFLQYHFSRRGHRLVADQLAGVIRQ